jgi:hypothetical protein
MARELVGCTLPHRDPGDIPVWVSRNGRKIMGIAPGVNLKTRQSCGYPYGTLPRLVLFWVTTEAVRTKSPRLHLGHTFSDFMRELGLDPSRGGRCSDAKRLRDQMERLFRCRISFEETTNKPDSSEGLRWLDMPVAPIGELWWNPRAPDQTVLWESWIELGEKFFEAIVARPVPVDLRALKALKHSPLALDLYAWATYRVFGLKKPQFVPWAGLLEQLGTDYKSVDEFARKVKQTLRKVQVVYPGLKLEVVKGGFFVHPSPCTVRSATVQKQLA